MSEANARFLGTIPEVYDRHLGPVIFEPYAADLARRVTVATAAPLLEVACGTGILTQFAFNVWGSFEQNPFGRIAHETIGSFFSAYPPNFYQVPFGFHDPDVLRSFLGANDFGQVELAWVALEARSPSAKSLAVGLVKGNPRKHRDPGA